MASNCFVVGLDRWSFDNVGGSKRRSDESPPPAETVKRPRTSSRERTPEGYSTLNPSEDARKRLTLELRNDISSRFMMQLHRESQKLQSSFDLGLPMGDADFKDIDDQVDEPDDLPEIPTKGTPSADTYATLVVSIKQRAAFLGQLNRRVLTYAQDLHDMLAKLLGQLSDVRGGFPYLLLPDDLRYATIETVTRTIRPTDNDDQTKRNIFKIHEAYIAEAIVSAETTLRFVTNLSHRIKTALDEAQPQLRSYPNDPTELRRVISQCEENPELSVSRHIVHQGNFLVDACRYVLDALNNNFDSIDDIGVKLRRSTLRAVNYAENPDRLENPETRKDLMTDLVIRALGDKRRHENFLQGGWFPLTIRTACDVMYYPQMDRLYLVLRKIGKFRRPALQSIEKIYPTLRSTPQEARTSKERTAESVKLPKVKLETSLRAGEYQRTAEEVWKRCADRRSRIGAASRAPSAEIESPVEADSAERGVCSATGSSQSKRPTDLRQ